MVQAHTRGLRDDDDRYFAPPQISRLRTAQEELRFLLDRGYPIKSAGTFVGNHHQLTIRQLLAVTRSTSSSVNLRNREAKRLPPGKLAGRTVYIDGFNQIISLEVALSYGMLFIGQDSCVRDLAELRGTYRLIPQTEISIEIIRDTLWGLSVSKAVFLLDEPVSNSGRLKTKIYELDWPMPVEVQIIRSPDAALKRLPCVITSDSVILDECESWFNLTAYVIRTREEFKTLGRLVDLGQEENAV